MTIRPDQPYGEVSRHLYGHFSEHLHRVVYGGLWAELLEHRKFELPGIHSHLSPVAAGWEAIQPAETLVHRGETPEAYKIGPDTHHQQLVSFSAQAGGDWAGIRQGDLALDAGTTYEARIRVSAIGAIERLRLQLSGGETVELGFPDGARIASPFNPEPRHGHLLEARLRSDETGPGAFSVCARATPGTEGQLWIHSVSLLPEGHRDGLHAGFVDALRELPAGIVKYPGGCFADSYDWRLGVGPRDLRHGAVDHAWGTWDENDFGTDEFLRWCELTGTVPYLCANQGTGSPELAAAWVEYCNGAPDTRWGAARAGNGHPEPYGVKYWAVGNEVYGWWERGSLPAAGYAENVKRFAAAMRAADPTLVIAAQGDTGKYSEELLPLVAGDIDWLSVHHYSGLVDPLAESRRYLQMGQDFEKVIGRIVEAIKTTPGAGHVRIALDEWGWSNVPEHGPVAGAYAACVLNAMTRLAPYVAMGGHCCVVNPGGPVTRVGQRVERNGLFDLFSLYQRLHLDTAVRCETDEGLDATAFVGGGRQAVLVTNLEAEPVTVDVAGQTLELAPYQTAGVTR